MVPRKVTRRGVLRTGATLASVGVIGSLSGCSDLMSDDGDSDDDGGDDATSAVDYIPGRANLVMSLSVTALLDDQAIRGAVNDALDRQSAEESMMPSTVSGALDMFEQEEGVNPRNVNEVVLFGETDESAESDESDYVGWLTYTDWSADEITALIEEYSSDDSDIVTEEYNGTTVYVSDDGDEETERVAILDDGTIVLGRAGATNDVIDVRAGDMDAVSGETRSAWEAASGEYAKFATDVEPEDLPSGQAEAAEPTVENIKYVSGSVYADGDMRGMMLEMEAGSEQDASDIETFFEGQIALAEEQAEDPQAREFLEGTEISSAGTTVTVRNEVDVETITPIVTRIVSLFLLRVSSSQSGFETDDDSGTAIA